MKRDPDAHERSDTEETSPPPPPFNIFAKLPQIPLSSNVTPAELKADEPGNLLPPATRPAANKTGSPSRNDQAAEKRRIKLMVVVALLVGVLIGIALF